MEDTTAAIKSNARLSIDRILKNRDAKVPTEAEVNTAVDVAIAAIKAIDPEAAAKIDDKVKERVIAFLFHSYSRLVGDSLVLTGDPKSHIDWLYKRRADLNFNWSHWNRYRQYLLDAEELPVPVVGQVNKVTDQILELLEDPLRDGMWSVRGLVVGSVQSGKTANYCGLINKAVDAGYKVIIVVAGVHDNLRSQTQGRIDLGVVGIDTRRSAVGGNQYGVGGFDRAPVIHQLTTFDKDFDASALNGQRIRIGSDPVILVVKKHASILRNLRKWVMHVAKSPKPEQFRRPNRRDRDGKEDKDESWIEACPMLLIDDEADHASINTSRDDRTAINNALVELLTVFQKSGYVGYTATPYANLFSDPDDSENIFPRNFIINIPAPDNYVGVTKVFGSDDEADDGTEGTDGLPIVRDLDEIDEGYKTLIPPKHRPNFIPDSLPQSLKDAVRTFAITCAVRSIRSKSTKMSKHNSMLVHVSRWTNVIDRFNILLSEEKNNLDAAITTGSERVLSEMKAIWDNDFVPTFSKISDADLGIKVTWNEILKELPLAVRKIDVRSIHGVSGDLLDYDAQKEIGLSVIAIGGDKLSRGLTLESLSVSYFLRTSKMYDTLMQMGRWFGYKDGYIDLCRIYTSGQLISWYKHIALADRELRSEFIKMYANNSTPKDYGLKVRSHPAGLRITALSKMRSGTRRRLSFAGDLLQTSRFEKKAIERNFNQLVSFISENNGWSRNKNNNYLIKRQVSRDIVHDFISKLSIPYGTNKFTKEAVLSFLAEQKDSPTRYAESWTIACASLKDQECDYDFNLGEHRMIPSTRKIVDKDNTNICPNDFSTNRGNLLDPGDHSIDIDCDIITTEIAASLKLKKALDKYHALIDSHVGKTLGELAFQLTLSRPRKPGKDKPVRANGSDCRLVRSENEALLIIYPFLPTNGVKPYLGDKTPVVGLAISFSSSDNVETVEYVGNKIFEQEMLGLTDIDEGYYDDGDTPTSQLID